MKILFVVPYVPSLVRVRPYQLIQGLMKRGHTVRVMTLWSNDSERKELERLGNLASGVSGRPLVGLRPYWNTFRALPTREPLQAAYSWQPDLAKEIRRHVAEFDIVHVEHLRGARYGLSLKNGRENRTPIVWDSVDSIGELFQQASDNGNSLLTRMISRFELHRTKRYEAYLLGQFDRVVVTSANDAAAMRRINSNGADITVVPNGVDLKYFTSETAGTRRPSAIVMTGKMSYHANVAMAHHFVREVLPLIWAERPRIHLWIVGKDPPRSVRNFGRNAQIQVTGTVPDIRPFLRTAALAVAPAPYAVGIQNKVLEAMACETPVVASPQAVAGLSAQHGRHLLVAESAEEFSAAVLSLLADSGIRKALGRSGRRYVEEQHRWSDSVEQLEGVYGELIGAVS